MKIAVYPDFHKQNALESALEASEILLGCGAEVYFDESCASLLPQGSKIRIGRFDKLVNEADIVIACGGDGTIMRCAKRLSGRNSRLLGINTGRLGFLACLERDELGLLKELVSGGYSVNERMTLNARVVNGDAATVIPALNDIVISHSYSRLCDYRIFVDGSLLSTTRADGVIFSTPTGASAYALSAGGPLIEPHLDCIEFVSICPHSTFSRPMLLSSERKIRICPIYTETSSFYVCADGSEPIIPEKGGYIEIEKSTEKIRFVEIKKNSFFDSVNEKLIKPLKERNI